MGLPPLPTAMSGSALHAVLEAEAEARAALAAADATVAALQAELAPTLAADATEDDARGQRALATLEAEVAQRVRSSVDAEVREARAEIRLLEAVSDADCVRIADELIAALLHPLLDAPLEVAP